MEETNIVVVLSGMSDNKAVNTPLLDIAVSNDDSVDFVHILGRRFGPFDGQPSDNFDFGTQIWSLLNSRLHALDFFQSRIAAMALHCPKMRQDALENILREQFGSSLPSHGAVGAVEPGFIGVATTSDAATASSSGGRWFPGIVDDDITVKEPEFWHRFENNNDNKNSNNRDDDVFYLDFDADDDPPMDMALLTTERMEMHRMEMPFPGHHQHHEHDEHHHDHHEEHGRMKMKHHEHDHWRHHDDDEDEDFHHHDRHDKHHDHEEEIVEKFGSRGGYQTKPLPFNPLEENHHNHHNHFVDRSKQPLPLPDIIFSATIYTDFYDDGEGGDILGYSDDDDFVNWQLWNEDGSLNSGLLLFVALCAACSVVWSALLLQCASMGYAWATCCSRNGGDGRGRFIFLDSESEDAAEDEEEFSGKGWKKQGNTAVVIAAEFTKNVEK